MKSLFSIILLAGILFFNEVYAAKPVYSDRRAKAAIRGYDAVAYFTENKPVKGDKELWFEHNGAKWLFSSQENLDKFKNTPEKYMPQYGGYCAYAIANGSTASSKPEFFTIHNDKLYLNFSKSVYKKWLKDKDGYIKEANSEWPSIISN